MQDAVQILSSSHRKSLHCSASVFMELEEYQIMQSMNLFIYGAIKPQKQERWESENFDGKLHLRKQIKVQLRGMSMSINHKHGFIICATTSTNFSGTEQSDSTLTPLFPHHRNPGG